MSTRPNEAAVAAGMRGGDSLPSHGELLKKGAHGGTMVSPVRNIPPDEVIALETLRLGLRADTLKEVLLDGERAPTA